MRLIAIEVRQEDVPYMISAVQRDIEDAEELGLLTDGDLATAKRLLLLLKKTEQMYVYPF